MRLAKTTILIGELSLLLTFFGCLTFYVIDPPKALATPLMRPFGGYIMYRDIGTPPPAFCPTHIVVYDFVTDSVYGILNAPGSKVYDYGNLLTPGVSILGEYVPVTIPCVRPYPLYSLYQIGTSPF
jgi:hypothetical protein